MVLRVWAKGKETGSGQSIFLFKGQLGCLRKRQQSQPVSECGRVD